MSKLSTEEKEILDAFETGKLKKAKSASKTLSEHRNLAEATFKKDARINIRLSYKDLQSIKAKALREGIPYQTLVSSILHKYIDGQFIDKSADKQFNHGHS